MKAPFTAWSGAVGHADLYRSDESLREWPTPSVTMSRRESRGDAVADGTLSRTHLPTLLVCSQGGMHAVCGSHSDDRFDASDVPGVRMHHKDEAILPARL
jgi:hypothetical protein